MDWFDSNLVPRNRLYMTVEGQSVIHRLFIMQSFLSSFINRSCLLDHIFIITQSIRMYKLITHCSSKRISNSIWFLISRFLSYFSIKKWIFCPGCLDKTEHTFLIIEWNSHFKVSNAIIFMVARMSLKASLIYFIVPYTGLEFQLPSRFLRHFILLVGITFDSSIEGISIFNWPLTNHGWNEFIRWKQVETRVQYMDNLLIILFNKIP